MQVKKPIKVKYKSTNDPKIASKWLNNFKDVIACDFETATRYTQEELEYYQKTIKNVNSSKKDIIQAKSILNATALGHPSHCTITHCSIADCEDKGYVFIIDTQEIADVVLDFLTETDKIQIWHNYSYDGRFIRYYTYKDVKNVEDTQIFAKTLINHVETFKAKTSLKELAGAWYGDWGISADNFKLEQQYDPKVIHYAAIDSCATFKLWEYLNDFVKNYNKTNNS